MSINEIEIKNKTLNVISESKWQILLDEIIFLSGSVLTLNQNFLIRVDYNMTHGWLVLHPSMSSNLFFDFRFLTCLMFFSHISWIINFQDENIQLFRLSPSQLWHLSVESFKVCQLFRGLFLTVMSGPSSIHDFSFPSFHLGKDSCRHWQIQFHLGRAEILNDCRVGRPKRQRSGSSWKFKDCDLLF